MALAQALRQASKQGPRVCGFPCFPRRVIAKMKPTFETVWRDPASFQALPDMLKASFVV